MQAVHSHTIVMKTHRIHLNLDDVGHPPCIIVKKEVQVEKRHFLLKE